SKRTAAAVFLLSCSALLFQVAQTRLFSATLGYHLTFVAVSIALLGVGAGAAAATLVDRRSNAPSTSRLAAFASASYVLAMAVATVVDPAALVLAAPTARRRVALAAVLPTVLLTLALASAGDQLAPLRPAAFKPILEDLRRGATVEATRWDVQGRVDVVRYGADGASSAYDFLVDPAFAGARPRSLIMRIDLDASTLIVEGGATADGAVLDASVLATPYLLVDRPNVLVIGPGGGIDVLVALRRDARAVTGVDVNRAVIATVHDSYRGYGGALYDDPRVTVVADEARSFVRRSSDRYDVIVMTVV